MILPKPHLPLPHQHRLKEAIAIPETRVVSTQERYALLVDFPIKIQEHKKFDKNGLRPVQNYCCWMIPFFTAYMTKPAIDLAPVFVFSLSRIASTVRGEISTTSAISFVVFS